MTLQASKIDEGEQSMVAVMSAKICPSELRCHGMRGGLGVVMMSRTVVVLSRVGRIQRTSVGRC